MMQDVKYLIHGDYLSSELLTKVRTSMMDIRVAIKTLVLWLYWTIKCEFWAVLWF